MEKAQYAIMRFAKYKGPEIGNIEAHNERTKEKYTSNPDVDTSRSKYNFHLVKPPGKYRTESERQISAAGCRTRKDSILSVNSYALLSPKMCPSWPCCASWDLWTWAICHQRNPRCLASG